MPLELTVGKLPFVEYSQNWNMHAQLNCSYSYFFTRPYASLFPFFQRVACNYCTPSVSVHNGHYLVACVVLVLLAHLCYISISERGRMCNSFSWKQSSFHYFCSKYFESELFCIFQHCCIIILKYTTVHIMKLSGKA